MIIFMGRHWILTTIESTSKAVTAPSRAQTSQHAAVSECACSTPVRRIPDRNSRIARYVCEPHPCKVRPRAIPEPVPASRVACIDVHDPFRVGIAVLHLGLHDGQRAFVHVNVASKVHVDAVRG